MANKARTFQDGINEMNGYTINVIRFTSAYTTGYNSITGRPNRQCALHWGTITTPDGREISMGDKGMNTPQIKAIIGGTTRTYNRGNDGNGLNELIKIKEKLESLGMSTTEVDAKIEAKKEEIEAERNRVDNTAEIKRLTKEVKNLEKLQSKLESLGLNTDEIAGKIEAINAQIDSL